MELTQAYLKERLDYDPATGNLIWRERSVDQFRNVSAFRRAAPLVGRAAGSVNSLGYRVISIEGVAKLAHRLVWLWHTGVTPKLDIDHINRDPSDNRIENLRECAHSLNCRAGRSRHTVGYRGAYARPFGRWLAAIRIDGRSRHLGTFFSEKDAALAYARAAVDHFGAFAPVEAKELFNEAYP